MNILQAVLLGGVEGVTEFLPVSSTYHLILTSRILGLTQSDFVKLFEVFIQAGAILSVVFIYAKILLTDRDLLKKVVIAFIPTGIVGLTLYKVIKNVFFHSTDIMLGVFLAVGLVFVLYEYKLKEKKRPPSKTIGSLTMKEAVIIGLVQSLAIVPGVSRAGSVILGMMAMRYRRDEAARFSFMLAIPTILAASAYDLFKMRDMVISNSQNAVLLGVGFISAFITSYFVVKWLLQYLKTNTLTNFGFYRIILAIIILLFFT